MHFLRNFSGQTDECVPKKKSRRNTMSLRSRENFFFPVQYHNIRCIIIYLYTSCKTDSGAFCVLIATDQKNHGRRLHADRTMVSARETAVRGGSRPRWRSSAVASLAVSVGRASQPPFARAICLQSATRRSRSVRLFCSHSEFPTCARTYSIIVVVMFSPDHRRSDIEHVVVVVVVGSSAVVVFMRAQR